MNKIINPGCNNPGFFSYNIKTFKIMEKISLRQQLINTILIKNDDEDNDSERAFLEQLSMPELKALAGENPDDEIPEDF